MQPSSTLSRREPAVLLAMTALALVVSGIGPKDRFTWLLEVAPVLIGAPLLVWFSRQVPLTLLVCRLLFLHGLILMIGGHWDTQSDMCLALVGAMCAQVLLARRQDRELAALDVPAAIPHAV